MLRWLLWLVFLPITLPLRTLRVLVWTLWPCNTLTLTLHGNVVDVGPESRWFQSPGTPLFSLLAALASAETDEKLRRVLVKVEGFHGGLGRAEELRAALALVRRAGKDVIVVADHLDLAGYWLALGATRIHLSPTGSLEVAGVASEFTLWKGLLDKVGVQARLAARGKYKSMREVFAENEMSAANREMLESLVADLYHQLEQRIAQARSLPEASIRGIVDQGPFRAEEAHRLGLVDAPRYEDDVRDQLEAAGALRELSHARYLKRRRHSFVPRRLPRVALLEVSGGIQLGEERVGALQPRSTSAHAFVRACERVRKDKSLRAILLRVNSPGGSALGSDLMWHALVKAKGERPLVVSMGNVAASGGYYVSGIKGARIFASACSVTGSIGVVGGKFEASRLYERLGVGKEIIRVGKHAAFHSPSVDFSEDELWKLQRDIDALYADFVAKMAEGRGVEPTVMEAAAQGRVWTGAQALEHRLIDELGGAREALDAVRRALGLAPSALLALMPAHQPGLAERLKRVRGRAEASALAELLPEELDTLFSWRSGIERLWFRMPFHFRVF
jgi:protease-4